MKTIYKKLLGVIVILLLVTVGITFAYYTSSTTLNGNGESAVVTTTTILNSTLKVEGVLNFSDTDILPGHQNVSSIKLTATGNNTLIPYNLIWTGTNTLQTTLNYKVYKTDSYVDVSIACDKQEVVETGVTKYYETCEYTNFDALGTAVVSGTITSTEEETKFTLVEGEYVTATSTGEEVYYYIVLEYPNLDAPQNYDMNGSFNGVLSVEESNQLSDINILAMYIEEVNGGYKQVSSMESRFTTEAYYDINYETSYCTNDVTIEDWNWDSNKIVLDNLTTSGTSCYLYFDIVQTLSTAGATIKKLAGITTISERTDFSTALTDETTGVVYTAADDDGPSYYYAGAATDNYVSFAGFYWRIIRINGDGSIRMIYDGTTARANGTSSSATQIGTSAFNSARNNNMYVGYMYTSGSVHGLGTSSTIKGKLDDWFTTNLSDYTSYIDYNAGFCGDRTAYTDYQGTTSGGGTGTTQTYYAAYIRLYTNKAPDLKCAESSDLYTTSSSSKGNRALAYPIGLITADEVAYAGGGYDTSNSSYYLYTGQQYWTMSPSWFYGGSNNYSAFVFLVWTTLSDANAHVDGYVTTYGVRPVINLRSDVTLSGSGISTDPYLVVGA